jgi:protein SCO1/2
MVKKVVLAACLAVVSCRPTPQVQAKRYEITGKVVSIDRNGNRVTLAHGDIPGYMPSMVMPFTVRDAWAMSVLSPGQTVNATLVVQNDRSWLEELVIAQDSGQQSAGTAAGKAKEPGPGDEVPDFQLTNQDGKRIHLSQYRGDSLLLTFIYTRCPLPDYCPRMSGYFSELYRKAKAGSLQKIHLLSISFDTEHDKPPILRRYGIDFAGSPEAFKIWEFATGSPEEVRKIATYFGLTYWKETGQIVHSLRTALISPDGKLVQLYRSNDWTPQQVIADLKDKTQGIHP